MKTGWVAVVVACGLLMGCGGTETASTDTAVTETVAPAALQETPDTVATDTSSTEPPTEGKEESGKGAAQGGESAEN